MDFLLTMYQHLAPVPTCLLVAGLLLLESSGIPVINTTLLLFTGALAALGRVQLGWLMVAAVAGSTLGACLAYALGRHYGEFLLLRLARLLRIDARKVLLAERWFLRAGGRMILISRLVPYIRPFACFPAGISAMPFPRFLLMACSGSIIWCVSLLIVGWELGPRWQLALQLVQTSTLPTLGVLLLLVVGYIFVRQKIHRYVKARLDESEKASSQREDLIEV
ncbi:MAG TPA: DedA family protein [Ktedonobacteraceae bacterium]|jgi:membrane protein DedA with SNARE-associated domain